MKKVTSLFLVLICCLSMSLPAFAAENTPSAEMLPYNGDAEISVFNRDDSVLFGEAISDLDNEGIVPYDYPPNAGLTQIICYPLAIAVDNPSQALYSSNIGAIITFNSYSQYNSLDLTYAQAQNIYNKLYAALHDYDSTKSYIMIGWIVEAYLMVRADNPLYVRWRAAEPNFGAGTDYTTTNVTSNLTTVRLPGRCEFPEGVDETTTTRFKLKGTEGLFYYRTNTGTYGIPFAASMTLNF